MTSPFPVAALQMVSTPDLDRNLATAARLIAQAADAGARLVALPEYFCLLGRNDRDKLAIAEAPGAGPIQDALAAAALRHGVWLVGGTLPLRTDDPDRVRNTCLVWSPQGAQVARYDKIHLFAFDNGSERYDEGRVLQAGAEPVCFDAEGWRIGLSICYDLRFPELYRRLMGAAEPAASRPAPRGGREDLGAARRLPENPPCDLILVPSAFTYTTGAAHWELLLRARAVENQCYVLAPAQGGRHENGRRTWGHSLLVDPWGELLACQPEGEAVVAGALSRERLAEVRRQLPALAHRRL